MNLKYEMEIGGKKYRIGIWRAGRIIKWGAKRERFVVVIRHGNRVARFYTYGDGGTKARELLLGVLGDLLFAGYLGTGKIAEKLAEKAREVGLGVGELTVAIGGLLDGAR